MNNEVQTEFTYTCKYCGKIYELPVRECESCGSTEFLRTAAKVRSKRKLSRKAWIIIAAVAAAVLLIVGVIASFGIIEELLFSVENSKYTTEEYDYDPSLAENDEMYLGKKYNSFDVNYYRSIKIYGSYDELYENVYNNIFSKQLSGFRFTVPCNIELRDNDLAIDITALEFVYYNSSGYVSFADSATGSTDKEISVYLVDENGNKDKLLMDKYAKEKYSSVAEYLCSDYYSKEFTLNNTAVTYKKLLVDIGGVSHEFDIDYSRANGSIEYYSLIVKQ